MMTVNPSSLVVQMEQCCEERSPQQQLERLAAMTSRITSQDVAGVQHLCEQAEALVPFCDWRRIAEELSSNQSATATAKWFAAALFESGADFFSASKAFDSFSCTDFRISECLRLLACARTLIKCGKEPDALAPLKHAIRLAESYRSLNACGKLVRLIDRVGAGRYSRTCRLAMLGNATFDFLLPALTTVAFASGIRLVVYSGAYNQHMQEVLDEASQLHSFRPDVIVLAIDWHSLALPEEAENPDVLVAHKLADVTGQWDAVASRFKCHIIQHNFVVPEVSAYGGLSGRIKGGRAKLMRQLNLQLVEASSARPDVSVLDVDEIASIIGKRVWYDARLWIAAKQSPSTSAIGLLASHEVALVRAIVGLTSKCLVLDLDNTLWGGVVGEDGLDGIRLGGSAEGEAFVEFQRYIKALRDRGVILAVCSKNDESDAKLPFQRHPEMVLTLDDISVFVANWSPKTENLREIAKRLNIGIDSLVFADDNPLERELVRKQIPEIEVLELPADPAGYVEALHRELLFETINLTPEDRVRAESYRANLKREELHESSASLEEFLVGLQMRVDLCPFSEPNLPRIMQLINKTNQFNLTTQRMSIDELHAFLAITGNYSQSMHLRDRFGDNGITGVLMATPVDDALRITSWLISCRVLGRKVEEVMLAAVWNFAKACGYRALLGSYVPTAKNQQVGNLYASFGFVEVSKGPDGEQFYRAELSTIRAFPRFLDTSDRTAATI